jgi:hypothetical protein
MEVKIYNNTLASKKYYDRNKDDSEFMKRKAVNTMRYYYKKKCHILYKRKYPILCCVFRAWKGLLIKEIVKSAVIKLFKKRVEEMRGKINKILLKRDIDGWKLYEKTPKANIIIYTSIVCSF